MNTLPTQHALGSEIRAARGERTIKEFAALLGVHPNTLLRYEGGIRLPDSDFLLKLYKLCGVEPSCVVLGRAAVEISDPKEAALVANYRRASKRDRQALARFALFAAETHNKENA